MRACDVSRKKLAGFDRVTLQFPSSRILLPRMTADELIQLADDIWAEAQKMKARAGQPQSVDDAPVSG